MKKLQCELCGSVDIIKIDNNVFQCQFCKCKYTAEQARAMIGVVEVTKGNAELNRLLNNAEAQVKLKNYIEAIKIYDLLSKEYPSEHIVWKKYLEFYYSEIRTRKDFSILDSRGCFGYKYPEFTSIQTSAILTCPESELKNFKAYIDNFWSIIYNNVRNGNFSFISAYYSWLDVAGKFHPLMQKLVDECTKITGKMNEMKIHYGFALKKDSSKESFWYNNYANTLNDRVFIVSIVGKECVCNYEEKYGDYPIRMKFILPFNASDDDAFYSKVIEIAQNNHASLSQCPFCNGKIKKSLFGRRYCVECKRDFPTIE